MSLRIIAGSFKGRLLKSPKGEQTRPTLAVMRKAVFDILQADIEDATFLDLYAGSGAMGFEALSRGGKQVTFVEQNRQALKCIEENSSLLSVQDQCTVLSYDVFMALRRMVKKNQRFDLVYIDPPYSTGLLEEILRFFDTHPLLNPKGILFLETAANSSLDPKGMGLSHLHYRDRRVFSRSALHQFYAFFP